jgi:phosphoribosylglycinamide formyltransferase-1
MTYRIGILISGRGSNMLALAEAVEEGRIPGARIVVVISDHESAAGLRLAAERGLETLCIERGGRARAEHEALMIAALRERGVDMVCLAGFMRLLSSQFIEAFRGRIINIHPSLLPSFPGLDAQRQALEHGVRVTGVTVHVVNSELDAGPIVLQAAVPVLEGDTFDTLEERILAEEHRLYPEAIGVFVHGGWTIVGRRFVRGAVS